MNKVKRVLATVLTLALVVTMLPVASMDVAAAKKIKLNKKKVTLFVGQKKKLKVKNKPKSVKVKWKSSKKKIAKVSKKGVVTAKKAGKTTIIAKVGKKKLKCKVVVKKHVVPETANTPVVTEAPITAPATQAPATLAPVTQEPATQATTKSNVTQATQGTTRNNPTQATQGTTRNNTTQAPTQGQGDSFDPATLTYQTITCEGGPELKYSIVKSVVGLVEFYENAGNTFSTMFTGDLGTPTSVTVNNHAPADGVIIESATGVVRVNPTKLADNAYSVIRVKFSNGDELVYVINKGKGGSSATTTRNNSTQATQAPTQAPTNVVPDIKNWNRPDNSTVNGDGSVSVDVPAYDRGNAWDTQLTYNGLSLENGKTYTLKVVMTSTVTRKFKAFVQSDGNNGGDWSYPSSTESFTVNANQDYTFTDTFTASNVKNKYLIGVMMGYVDSASQACRVTVKSATLTTTSQGGNQTQAPTSDPSSWTVVPASDGKVSYKNASGVSVINVQQPGFASNPGVYATVKEAIDHVTINGATANSSQVAIQGAGAVLYLSAIGTSDTTVKYYNAANAELGSVVYKNTAGGGGQTQATQSPTQATTRNGSQPTTTRSQSSDFTTDTSIQKPFGINITNPSAGIIRVVWGAGDPNCYNVYIDGVRKRTKVSAASYDLPVQTEGKHIVGITHVNPYAMTESERVNTEIYVSGTAPEETTAIAEKDMPQHDTSVVKQNGKIVLQLNNKTNGKYRDDQIYWIIVGRDFHSTNHVISYIDKNGNLIHASKSDNDGTIGNRQYSRKIVHTLADAKTVQLPEIESGRMYISYGEPVYITFNGEEPNLGYAGPDTNNPHDANYHTLFEYLEFTTEGVNGGITFHGNTTRVDFFSFPMVARLTDEYGGYDRCVGDVGTRSEIFEAYTREVSDKFDTLVTDERIMCPAKLTFGEGKQYGDFFDSTINAFWSKYANEDLVTSSEAGAFRGRVHGNRLIMSDSAGTYYIDKPTTQDVFEGRGAFNRISTENYGNANGTRCELAIEAMLCAAFTRGLALDTSKWWTVSEYYPAGSIRNEYAEFFHNHAVGRRAYGFCYDDVNDQSTLVECGNAERFTIDLKW